MGAYFGVPRRVVFVEHTGPDIGPRNQRPQDMSQVESTNLRKAAGRRQIARFTMDRLVAEGAKLEMAVEMEKETGFSNYSDAGYEGMKQDTQFKGESTLSCAVDRSGNHIGIDRAMTVDVNRFDARLPCGRQLESLAAA